MRDYDVKVSSFKNMCFQVKAKNREEAFRIVKNVIDKGDVLNLDIPGLSKNENFYQIRESEDMVNEKHL